MIRIKTPEEIKGIRKSSILAANALKYLSQFVKPGISTEFIDNKAAEYIKDHGATSACLNYSGFPKNTCTSINEVICHGIPSENEVLQEGDIINIDVTTILNGYYGDTSITFPVGEINKEAECLLQATKTCLMAGIAQVFPGNYFGNIGHNIAMIAQSLDYSVVSEFCGHGVGLEFHEQPAVHHTAPKDSGEIMKPGMVFTIEPILNIGKPNIRIEEDGWTVRTVDGKLSAQFEHTVMVTKTGVEILTKTN